jgi:hypothetical protein
MGYIYQIKNNKSGKCYIGQTTTLPENRWKQFGQHCSYYLYSEP